MSGYQNNFTEILERQKPNKLYFLNSKIIQVPYNSL